ncbi:folate family ECF transporter S component [Streptococcus dentasini]
MFSKNYFPQLTTKQLVTLAMLVALSVAVSKFSIPIIPQQLVFSLTFLVSTMIGAIGGPLYSFICLGLIDIVDSLSGGTSQFIIWWTLLEAAQGALYGIFFYGKALSWHAKKDWLYVSLATLTIMLVGTFIFTPLLIQIYYHTPISVQYLAGRWLKIFEIPFRIILTMLVMTQLQRLRDWRQLTNTSQK